jgi:hypothetical protein
MKLSLSICLAFAFFVASAVAQTAPAGSQGTQNSSPSMQQQQQQGQYPSQGTNQSETSAQQSDQSTGNHSHMKGEHTIKGCVQSEGGQYMLQTKKGKDIALSGQDVSAHVGHEVAVKGSWESGSSMSSASSSNAGTSGAASQKTFNVTSVQMISDTCKMKGEKGNSGMAPQGSTGNSSTQPPQ